MRAYRVLPHCRTVQCASSCDVRAHQRLSAPALQRADSGHESWGAVNSVREDARILLRLSANVFEGGELWQHEESHWEALRGSRMGGIGCQLILYGNFANSSTTIALNHSESS